MQALDSLVEVILMARNKGEIKNLLLGLLTPGEIEELAQRIEIVRLLKKGIGQHEIAKRLQMGVATVSRGAREIKMGNFKTL